MITTLLPTSNQAWGFWGTIGHQEIDRSQAWALATIGEATAGAPEAVRVFLAWETCPLHLSAGG